MEVVYEESMEDFLNTMMCSTLDDEERSISEWIDEREVPDFPAFSKETKKSMEKRIKFARRRAQIAEELLKKAEEGYLFELLEAKYSLPKKPWTSKTSKETTSGGRGSKYEMEDLKTAYVVYQGHMEDILNNVMCSTDEDDDDEEMFWEIISDWIEEGEVPDFHAFSREKRIKVARRQAQEAEEMKKEAEEDYFFELLEAKYAPVHPPKRQYI